VNEVARGLWCPLCSGVRLDACELQACIQMKDMIAIKLAEGASDEEIKAYFAEQYGPQVFGEPPREGFNWLAWILPVFVLLAGGYFAWSVVRRMTGHAHHPVAASTGDAAQSKAQADDYSQKLEQELSRYD
jgi:cytochrome c-type biogenesis protein CcmH